MQTELHVEGLDLLRKAIVIGVVGSIVSAIGGALAFVGAPGHRVLSLLSLLISLAAWYFQFNGWHRLCQTGVEGFFCTAYTAVKWGMLASLILLILGSLVMLTAPIPTMRPGMPPPRSVAAAFGALMVGGALSALGGLIALVVAIILLIAYFKLASVYQAPNVKWGVILMVVGIFLAAILIGAILMLVGLVLLYIGLGDAIENAKRGEISRPA